MLHQSFLLSSLPLFLSILFPVTQASSSASFSIFVPVAICASWLSLCLRWQRRITRSLLRVSVKTASLSRSAALGDMFLRCPTGLLLTHSQHTCCHKYSRERRMWIHLPLKIVPHQMDYFFVFPHWEAVFEEITKEWSCNLLSCSSVFSRKEGACWFWSSVL